MSESLVGVSVAATRQNDGRLARTDGSGTFTGAPPWGIVKGPGAVTCADVMVVLVSLNDSRLSHVAASAAVAAAMVITAAIAGDRIDLEVMQRSAVSSWNTFGVPVAVAPAFASPQATRVHLMRSGPCRGQRRLAGSHGQQLGGAPNCGTDDTTSQALEFATLVFPSRAFCELNCAFSRETGVRRPGIGLAFTWACPRCRLTRGTTSRPCCGA